MGVLDKVTLSPLEKQNCFLKNRNLGWAATNPNPKARRPLEVKRRNQMETPLRKTPTKTPVPPPTPIGQFRKLRMPPTPPPTPLPWPTPQHTFSNSAWKTKNGHLRWQRIGSKG